MSDDTTKRNPQDASKINVHESWELTYWTKKFGVTDAELKAAVEAVGPGAKKVEEHLGK